MAEVVRTNFAPIVSDFENFHAHWCTNRPIVAPGASDKFQMIKSVLSTERTFLPGKKRCKLHLNWPTNTDAISSWITSLRHVMTVKRPSVIYKKEQKQCLLRGTAIPAGPTRLLYIATREHTSVPIHVVQKIIITRTQKIKKSAVWHLILCSGADKKFEHGPVHNYKSSLQKAQKYFWKLRGFNSISVSTNGGTAFRFFHYRYEHYSFLWHHVTR